MGRSHKKPARPRPAELSDLVAGVARIIGTRANDLQTVARKLSRGPGKAAKTRAPDKADRSTIASELQASFQALTPCTLLV